MLTLWQLTLDLTQQAQAEQLPGSTSNFGEFLSSVLSVVLTVGALLVLIYLLWGAIEWITAGGDSSKVQKARDKITQSIIGLIVLSATVALFGILQTFLGIQILEFIPGTKVNPANYAQQQSNQQLIEGLNVPDAGDTNPVGKTNSTNPGTLSPVNQNTPADQLLNTNNTAPTNTQTLTPDSTTNSNANGLNALFP